MIMPTIGKFISNAPAHPLTIMGYIFGTIALKPEHIKKSVTASAIEKKAYEVVLVTGDCNGCGLCVPICPIKNLKYENGHMAHNKNGTTKRNYRQNSRSPKTTIFYISGSLVVVSSITIIPFGEADVDLLVLPSIHTK